ncbi:MAG TPA: hypothetical protein PK225_05650 [Azonexus sp.]|jgi:hypothetical protein|nr:hypothetical protein [Azonexus sp.]
MIKPTAIRSNASVGPARLIRRKGQQKGGHIANRTDQRHQDEAGPPATGAPEGDPRRDEDQRKTTHP